MSKTPRTDAAEVAMYDDCFAGAPQKVVPAKIARQLETELADARAEIERLKKLQQFATAINCAMLEADFDPEYLRGHECAAKHKLLSMLDLWRKKVKPRLPGFIDDEISKRDKLIEQMREALKAIDAIGSEKGDASRDDALRCFSIARAALAAERGE